MDSYQNLSNGSSPAPTTNALFNSSHELLAFDYVLMAVQGFVFLMGTPANAFVIFLAFRILNKRQRRRNCDWFIMSMTLWDFVYCSFYTPMMVKHIFYSRHHFTSCIAMTFSLHASTIGSCLSLLLINMDKLIRVYKRSWYRKLVTMNRAILFNVLASVTAICAGVFFCINAVIKKELLNEEALCNVRYEPTFWTLQTFLLTIFFILPTVTSLVLCIVTVCIAARNRKHLLRAKAAIDNLQTADAPGCSKDGAGTTNKHASHYKIFGFTFTTTIWTAIATMPSRIEVYMLADAASATTVARVFSQMCSLLACLNAVGNPIITLLTKSRYARGAKKACRRGSVRTQATVVEPSSKALLKGKPQQSESGL